MEHRKVGTSRLELPVVTFGAWAIGGLFWGGNEDKEGIEAIQAAVDHGIDAIDTAPMYGCGHSEQLVGQAVAGRRDKLKLLTKCGLRWDENEGGEFYFRLEQTPDGTPVTVYKNVTAKSILTECEQSLKRLATDYIDLYQVHWPSKTAPAEETVGALNKLKEQGKIREFGVSNYNSHQLREALKYGAVVSDQVKYNLLERDIEKDELPACRQRRIGVIAYSPMAMGLLSGKVTPDREFAASDIRSTNPLFSQANRQKVQDALEKLRPIAATNDADFATLAVAWVLAQPGVTTALVGARNAQQAAENSKAASIKLSQQEVEKIRQVFASLGDLRRRQ
ncbi:MAG: aldo/keto reductase [Acidobacteria bacterium]|nr:MAG: aldo/keto reductase [Acidobacteriota bacterium]